MTPNLVGAQVLPFVSNNSLSSSIDGRRHTFNWSPVLGIESVRVQVWDRSLMPAQPAQFVSSQGFSGTTNSFVIDLDLLGSPYFAYFRPSRTAIQCDRGRCFRLIADAVSARSRTIGGVCK